MSTTEIYAVDKEGNVKFYGEANNSWKGATFVWNELNDKYNLNDGMFFGFKKVWGNFGTALYTPLENIILGTTFDGVLVKKENIKELIESFENYHKQYPDTNFNEQANILKQILEEDLEGVAWCQTSVANDAWDFDYDEENEEIIPYNINKGDKHWYLFDDIKGEF